MTIRISKTAADAADVFVGDLLLGAAHLRPATGWWFRLNGAADPVRLGEPPDGLAARIRNELRQAFGR